MTLSAHYQMFGRYNAWANGRLYDAAARLGSEQYCADRGAFFRSVHGTLNHLVWGDRAWLYRFGVGPKVAVGIKGSTELYADWDELKRERERLDQMMIDWAGALDEKWLDGDLTWFSGAMQREMTMPKWLLVTHLFNHQTHHRGQVHGMLSQAGIATPVLDLHRVLIP